EWPLLVERLQADAGVEVALCTGGSLLVAHQADLPHLDRLERAVRRHVGQDPAMHALDRAALAQLEPSLAERFHRALWMEPEMAIANDALFAALLAAMEKRGAALRFQRSVQRMGQGWLEAGERRTFDWVVDCRGIGARSEIEGLRGVRGEVVRVRAPEVDLSRPVRLLHPRYPLYVVPRPGDRFVIGATEIESESRDGVTVRSALELLSALFSLHPGFAEAEIEAMLSNLRPAFGDHRPRLEISDGLVRINGLYRHGYLLAPAMTGWVENLILRGEAPEHPVVLRTASAEAESPEPVPPEAVLV
ncbi:MAG: FAD-dependent oxidoreductase, partial [Acidobacteriota bacterium]